MNLEQFIEMCQRMVVQYYNRYVHMDEYEVISIDNVEVKNISESDDSHGELIMRVDIDPWSEYKIIFDSSKRGDIKLISSSTYMT